jgi:hypothetical protein
LEAIEKKLLFEPSKIFVFARKPGASRVFWQQRSFDGIEEVGWNMAAKNYVAICSQQIQRCGA